MQSQVLKNLPSFVYFSSTYFRQISRLFFLEGYLFCYKIYLALEICLDFVWYIYFQPLTFQITVQFTHGQHRFE